MEYDDPFNPMFAASTEENLPKIIGIAPDGDVVLVVGPEKARFRVSTGSLGAASKVFKAMFSANWAEGQNLSSAAPKEIEFPEDDSTAMETICCVLHFRNDIVPSLGYHHMLKIAITADKYDLVLALRYATTAWLNRPQPRKKLLWTDSIRNPERMLYDGYLLAAAYILQDAQCFARISHDLICHYTESYADLYRLEELRDALHPMTIYRLEDRRARLGTEIQKIWDDGINEACVDPPNQAPQAAFELDPEQCAEAVACGCGRKRMEKYKALRERYQNGVHLYSTPIAQLVWESDQSMVDDILDMGTKASHRSGWFNGCSHPYLDYEACLRCQKKHPWRSHSEIEYHQTFNAQWEKLKRRYCLCFDCLEGTLPERCPFHHENLELEDFTPAKDWEFDLNADGW